MVIPVIQIIFFAGVVGGNVKDVKLLYTNDDHCKLLHDIAMCVCMCVQVIS